MPEYSNLLLVVNIVLKMPKIPENIGIWTLDCVGGKSPEALLKWVGEPETVITGWRECSISIKIKALCDMGLLTPGGRWILNAG